MINQEETMKNKAIAKKFYELIAARKYDEAAKLCSDDFVYYPQVSTRLEGVDEFIKLEKGNMDPAGDFKMETKFIIAENDRAAVYLTFEGNLIQDNWRSAKVKNKHVYFDFMTMLRFKDGKIIEKRAKYDRLDFLNQMGVENFDLKY